MAKRKTTRGSLTSTPKGIQAGVGKKKGAVKGATPIAKSGNFGYPASNKGNNGGQKP